MLHGLPSRLLLLTLLLLGGCAAAYTPPPLTPAHPAHPQAAVAPLPPASTTLAYGPADLPAPQPAAHHVAQQMPHGHPSAAQSPQRFVGEGTVIAVVPSSAQLVVEHGEIKGFMGAMTMGYRVEPPALLEGLQTGDRVRFTIDAQRQAIVEIEKLPR